MAMATGHCQDVSDKVFGRKLYVVPLRGALDFMPNLLRSVIVCPSLEVGAIIRTWTRFFAFPQNSFE
jgi:hypothetical protein